METLPNFQKGVQTPSITHQITFDSPFPLVSSIDDHLDLSYFFPSYVLSVHMYVVAMQPAHAAVKTARWLRKCHFIFRYMPSPLQAFFTKANKSCWSDFKIDFFQVFGYLGGRQLFSLWQRSLSQSFFRETNFEKEKKLNELNCWTYEILVCLLLQWRFLCLTTRTIAVNIPPPVRTSPWWKVCLLRLLIVIHLRGLAVLFEKSGFWPFSLREKYFCSSGFLSHMLWKLPNPVTLWFQ